MHISEKIIHSRIVLRHALPGDLEGVASLLDQLGYPLGRDAVREIYLELLDDPRARIWVAPSDDGLIGLMSLREYPALRLGGCFLNIEELVVDTRFRGLGIGARFLERALSHARDVGALRLEVHSSNKRESVKRRFYAKNGFMEAKSTTFRMDFDHMRNATQSGRTKSLASHALTAAKDS